MKLMQQSEIAMSASRNCARREQLRAQMLAMLGGLLGLVGTAGCGFDTRLIEAEASADSRYEVEVRFTKDPGRPLAGVNLVRGGKVLATSDDAGTARTAFVGKEGDVVELSVQCPDDYEPPGRPLGVTLRRLAKGSPPPQFEARCTPLFRSVVVGVTADNGPDLPVMYLGREVARTDASGAAQFVLKSKPGEPVEITLGTAEASAQRLRPKNPVLTFVPRDADDFVVLEQKFVLQPKPVVYRKVVDARPRPL